MITIDFDETTGVLILTPEGPLQEDDFQVVAQEVDPYIDSQGVLTGLVVHVKKFPGWENLDALITHIRFVHDHHKKIRKVALVSDGSLIKQMPKLVDHFVAAEVHGFDYDQLEEAKQWIVSGGA